MKLRVRFRVLDRYLLTQVLGSVAFGVLLFSVVWLAPETLFRLIQAMFAGKITLAELGAMFALHLPAVTQQSIPIAALMGSLFAVRRLSLNLEWVILQGAGIPTRRLLMPLLVVGALFALLQGVIQEAVIPLSSPVLDRYYRVHGLRGREDSNFVFLERNRDGQLDKFFLIGQTQGEPPAPRFQDFILLYYKPWPDGGVQVSRILRAATGEWSAKARSWQLRQGVDYELDEEGVFRESRPFKEQWVNTSPYPVKLLAYGVRNPLEMRATDLARYTALLEAGGQRQNVPFYRVRLAQKAVLPLAPIVFVLLGALLGVEPARANRSYGLLMGAVVIFLYSILLPMATHVGALGWLPAWAAALMPLTLSTGVFWGLMGLKKRLLG